MIAISQRAQRILLLSVFFTLMVVFFIQKNKENTQLKHWKDVRSRQHHEQQHSLQKTLTAYENTLRYLSSHWDPNQPSVMHNHTYSHWLKHTPEHQNIFIFSTLENDKVELATKQTPPIRLSKNWQQDSLKLTDDLYIDKAKKWLLHPFQAVNQKWWLGVSLNHPIFELQYPKLTSSTNQQLIYPNDLPNFLKKHTLSPQIGNQSFSDDNNDYFYTAFHFPSEKSLTWGLLSIRAKSTPHNQDTFFILSILAFSGLLPWYFYRQWQKEKQLSNDIQDNLQRHQSTLEHTTIGMMILNTNGKLLSTNKKAQIWLPFRAAPNLQHNVFTQLHNSHFKKALWKIHKQSIQKNKPQTIEYNQSPDTFTLSAHPYHYHHHTEILICIQNNVEWHQRKQKHASLKQALEENEQSVLIVTANGNIEFMNRNFKDCYSQHLKKRNRQWVYACLKHDFPDKQKRKQFLKDITSGSRTTFVLQRNKNQFIEKTVYPLLNNENKITHYIYTGKDITEQTHKKRNLYTLAHYDQVTGLPNRVLLSQKLKKKCHQNKKFTLCKIEWRLTPKWVNKLTHEEMLDLRLKYAKNLKQHLTHSVFLAKVEENRFVFFSDKYEHSDLLTLCGNLLQQLPNQLHTQQYRVVDIQHSLGVCPILDEKIDAELILQRTRLALHFAIQRRQRSQFFIYSNKMETEHQRHYQLIDELKNSLGTEQYQLHYQPKVNKHNQLVGVEALLRWQDQQGKTHSPLKVVNLLEETQLIHLVGKQILHKACQQAAIWHQNNQHIHVAVNISAEQLNEPRFIHDLQKILNDTHCPTQYLELEITESVLMKNTKKSHQTLQAVHELGIQIAIDDFGTGYSSLAYLNQFPFDILKIDRAFISGLPHQNNSIVLTQCIIELAKNLNKRIVAEGIENQAQLMFLNLYHIDEYQGYFFNRPMPINELEDYYQLRTSVIN